MLLDKTIIVGRHMFVGCGFLYFSRETPSTTQTISAKVLETPLPYILCTLHLKCPFVWFAKHYKSGTTSRSICALLPKSILKNRQKG